MNLPPIPAFLISLAIPCSLVRNDLVPFVSRRAGDECDHGLGIAHVEDFVRHTGLDVDEIASLIFDRLLQASSEFVTHFSFDDVKDHFEADMDVRVGHATWRNSGDIGRQACCSHVLARHALFVMDSIPIASRAAAANR